MSPCFVGYGPGAAGGFLSVPDPKNRFLLPVLRMRSRPPASCLSLQSFACLHPRQDVATVRHLLRRVEPLSGNVCCLSVLDRFLLDEEVYALPVVDDGARPIALIDRASFIEFFSRRYSRDVFGRRSILELLAHPRYSNGPPLVIGDDCTVEDAARTIIGAGMRHMVTGFIVSAGDRYLGVADGRDLLDIITQRKQAVLYQMAHYDALTGIPNRALFTDRLERACLDADRSGRLVALLFIDVDRFKQINDSLGHSAGDEVLRRVVGRLKACARQVDTVARLAGDEFVILMEDLTHPDQVAPVARRIVDSMQEPMDMLGHAPVITVSIGSAIYPHDDLRIGALLTKADAAMYEAKAAGRNGFRSYSPEMPTGSVSCISLESELRKAIERDELELHFQPQLALDGQQVCGVEALLRWQHPERGMVPPLEFIPVAEESGLIVGLGAWVVKRALAQLRSWLDDGLPPLRMSVNISALQFRQPGFADFLASQLVEHRLPGDCVELELTESVLMHNADEVLCTLNAIKALGVRLAIDDFGTGYSSLGYLRRLPIDRLKIDQSFVRDIDTTPVNESIARAIIALANSLSLDIVAEGIETEAELSVLRCLNCHQGQGYLFSRPLAAAALIAWWRVRSPRAPVLCSS